jgi:putative transposase
MAENAVARRGASIALAVWAVGVSRTCYRYGPKLRAEKQAIVRHWFEPNGGEIVDLLTGLTDARKTWGFGLCFLHLRDAKGNPWNHKRVYPSADRRLPAIAVRRIYCQLELNLRPLMA